jgi:predicted RNA-binding Zn-ribbon protein involved in translation (DUF1610 family)
MTLAKWAPSYREEEDSHRFCGPRFVAIAPENRVRRLAVCAECLEEDTEPYLRLWWMTGWVAVCPRHGTILVARCAWCRGHVRIARLSAVNPFAPRDCTSCGKSLQDGVSSPSGPTTFPDSRFCIPNQPAPDSRSVMSELAVLRVACPAQALPAGPLAGDSCML